MDLLLSHRPRERLDATWLSVPLYHLSSNMEGKELQCVERRLPEGRPLCTRRFWLLAGVIILDPKPFPRLS